MGWNFPVIFGAIEEKRRNIPEFKEHQRKMVKNEEKKRINNEAAVTMDAKDYKYTLSTTVVLVLL